MNLGSAPVTTGGPLLGAVGGSAVVLLGGDPTGGKSSVESSGRTRWPSSRRWTALLTRAVTCLLSPPARHGAGWFGR